MLPVDDSDLMVVFLVLSACSLFEIQSLHGGVFMDLQTLSRNRRSILSHQSVWQRFIRQGLYYALSYS